MGSVSKAAVGSLQDPRALVSSDSSMTATWLLFLWTKGMEASLLQ